jgi:hypothetical protein
MLATSRQSCCCDFYGPCTTMTLRRYNQGIQQTIIAGPIADGGYYIEILGSRIP